MSLKDVAIKTAKPKNIDYKLADEKGNRLHSPEVDRGHVSFTQEYYKGPATALEIDDRQDDRLSLGLNVSWEFTESWTLEVGYQYMNNASRSNLYDYDRHMVTMGVG